MKLITVAHTTVVKEVAFVYHGLLLERVKMSFL